MDTLKYQVKTFGCKVNLYDTGLLQKNMSQRGFELQTDSNIFVFNTCAVTAKATQEAVKEIKKLKRNKPEAKVVVTGCSAQVDTDYFSELEQVDLVIANSHKADLPKILRDYLSGITKEKVYKSNIFKNEDLGVGGGRAVEQTRSFLKIQDGCNSFCTFCIIPFARGKSRSLPSTVIVDAVKKLVDEGVGEIVLTGVHIGDYADPNGIELTLSQLVAKILKETTVKRLRLSSLEPIEVTDELFELYAAEQMCAHFHLSVQSCDTEVLQKMKRNYGEKEVRQCFEKIQLRYPQAYVGMDLIAGFSDETLEQHQNTLRVLQENQWTKIHVFPYSRRGGTVADKYMSHLSDAEIRNRASDLKSLSQSREEAAGRAQIEQTKRVLILKSGTEGLSSDYWPVKFLQAEPLLPGQEWQVRIRDSNFSEKLGQSRYLSGEVIRLLS